MKLKAGDYIELEGVSEEGLRQVRDAFVAAGFENEHGLDGRYTWEAFGAVTDYECCFLHSRGTEAKRLLTIDQVLSTNIEFEEAHQQVVQATEVSEEEEEAFVAMSDKKVSKYDKLIKSKFDASYVTADVYEVLKAWNVTNPALQHLIKKALQAGDRGHKSITEDMNDIVADVVRRATQ